jgi:hypothetical protein
MKTGKGQRASEEGRKRGKKEGVTAKEDRRKEWTE